MIQIKEGYIKIIFSDTPFSYNSKPLDNYDDLRIFYIDGEIGEGKGLTFCVKGEFFKKLFTKMK